MIQTDWIERLTTKRSPLSQSWSVSLGMNSSLGISFHMVYPTSEDQVHHKPIPGHPKVEITTQNLKELAPASECNGPVSPKYTLRFLINQL